MRYPYYPRRRSGAMWILVLVIIVAAIWYANSQGIIHLNLPNFGNLSSSQNNLVGECVQKINACGETINTARGTNITLLKQTQVENANDANTFLKTWAGTSQPEDISAYSTSSYPIAMIATRFDNTDGTKVPYVFMCKSDGNFEDASAGLCHIVP